MDKICDKIDNEKNIILPADKTNNFYSVEPEKYLDMLNKNIQKEYKKTDRKTIENVYKKDKKWLLIWI